MNIFRLFGDLSHLLAIVLLLLKIWKTRSCAGISGKSQILFLVVFVSRYLDLLTSFISLYNTVMKLFFIGSAAGTVYLMYLKFKVSSVACHSQSMKYILFRRPTTGITTPLGWSSCWDLASSWHSWSTTSSA